MKSDMKSSKDMGTAMSSDAAMRSSATRNRFRLSSEATWPGLAESSRLQCLADGPEKFLLANWLQKNPGADAMRGLRSLDEFLAAGYQDNG
jgi:hypothetical protein